MTSYKQVNDALNEAIFGGRFEGRPVYITLGARGREIVAKRTGFKSDTLEDDVSAVAANLFDKSGNPYKSALSLLERWQEDEPDLPPPFTGILFCLAHAAERMEDAEGISSANYYDRLEQVAAIPRNRLQQHTKRVVALWAGLNQWLERTGYRFGRPTAVPFEGAWRYVGYALSQAVVRAADKKRFIQMFDRYDFVPGETLTERDIAPYIDLWLSTAAAPARLKRRWSQEMLRPRIAQTALETLQSWDGASPTNLRTGSVEVRLSIAALFEGFPLRFSLHLGLQQELGTPIEGLRRVGVAESDPDFTLSNVTSGVFASISPSSAVNASQILRHGIKFQSKAGSSYAYYPKDVVPFVKAPSGSLWRTVNRVRFGERHMVLVRDTEKVRADVEDILAEVSDPSKIKFATALDFPGVPSGWALYQNVMIVRSACSHFPDQISILDPIDESSTLILEGGMRLGQGIWHGGVPPTARLLAQESDTRIDVYHDREGIKSEPLLSATSGSSRCHLTITPPQLGGAAALAVVGTCQGTRVTSQRLILRSANQPRPPTRDGGEMGGLRYLDTVSATAVGGPATGQEFVQGFEVRQSSEAPERAVSYEGGWKRLPFVASPEHEPSSDADGLDDRAASAPVSAASTTRHVHIWLCEPFEGKRSPSAPMSMECKECGKATIERNRGRPRERNHRSTVPVFKPTGKRSSALSAREVDYLVDAVCFLGHGNWSRFDAVASAFTDDGLIAREAASNLASLGIIDLELEAGTARAKRWSVCPPQLVFTDAKTAFMTGFRCASLVEDLAEMVNQIGGQIDFLDTAGQPTRIRVSETTATEIADLVTELRDPLNRSITVLENVPATLLSACRRFAPIEATMRPISMGQCFNLQKLQLPSARWSSVERVNGAGSYRFEAHGRTYCVVDADGQAFAGPHQLVKLLSARQQGYRLHDYREEAAAFVSVPGAEPVGLFARALVACSGALPTFESGYTIFGNVPAHVASSVLDIFYGKDPES